MVDIGRNRVVTNDMKALRALCRKVRSRTITQINDERISVRKAAKKMGISHWTLLDWKKNPDKNLSRKLMKRIVMRMTKEKKKKILIAPIISALKFIWCRHTI
jgi:transposase